MQDKALAAGAAVLFHAMFLAFLGHSDKELRALPAGVASVTLILAPASASIAAIQRTAPAVETESAIELSPVPTATPSLRLRMHAVHFFAAGKAEARLPAEALAADRAGQRAVAAQTVPVPARSGGSGPDVATLELVIDKAIRDAAVMPAAARRQRREGRVLVRLSYLDGAVDAVSIQQSSQFRLLDDAALLAVHQASYPMAPVALQGRRLDLSVWIDFRIVPS